MSTTGIHIGPADHGRRMTLEEFREAGEEPGYLYELARGILEVSEIPGDDHWQIIDTLHEAFSRYRRERPGLIHRIGHGSDVRFIIPEWESDRHPDLAILLRGDPPDHRGRRRPTVAIEVVSPGARARRRDFEEKREEYLTVGPREYWIVDPERRRVLVLTRRGEGDATTWEERTFAGDAPIVSETFPDFPARVSDLWSEVEPAEGGENGAG
jgi:Uma2 family endonuclease